MGPRHKEGQYQVGGVEARYRRVIIFSEICARRSGWCQCRGNFPEPVMAGKPHHPADAQWESDAL